MITTEKWGFPPHFSKTRQKLLKFQTTFQKMSLCVEKKWRKEVQKCKTASFSHRKLFFVCKRHKGVLFLTSVDTPGRQNSAHLSEMCTAQKYQHRKMEKSSRMSGLKWQEHPLPCPLSLKFPEDSATAPNFTLLFF